MRAAALAVCGRCGFALRGLGGGDGGNVGLFAGRYAGWCFLCLFVRLLVGSSRWCVRKKVVGRRFAATRRKSGVQLRQRSGPCALRNERTFVLFSFFLAIAIHQYIHEQYE